MILPSGLYRVSEKSEHGFLQSVIFQVKATAEITDQLWLQLGRVRQSDRRETFDLAVTPKFSYFLFHRLELLVVRRQIDQYGSLAGAVEGQVRVGACKHT